MMVYTVRLEDRGVLRVGGDDAASFLQGLLTNDVERLPEGEARYAALLSPQGKILFDLLVLRIAAPSGAAFLVDCPAAQAAELAKRLGFYRLRARVAIADESARLAVIASWAEGDAPAERPSAGFAFADPRDPRLGFRAIVPVAEAPEASATELEAYEAHRIALGVPRGGVDFAYADIFPHDANLDLLHGVDFEKGCYVGQEVVSRMRHRGGPRKRIVRLTIDGPPPAPGTPVVAGESTLGALGSAAQGRALAMLRLDRLEDARGLGQPLSAGGAAVAVDADGPGF